MLVQIGNGYTHYSVIVTGNISGLIYVDGIVVVVVRIFLGAILLVEGEFLVSLLYVEVRKPADVTKASPLISFLINPKACRTRCITIAGYYGCIGTPPYML